MGRIAQRYSVRLPRLLNLLCMELSLCAFEPRAPHAGGSGGSQSLPSWSPQEAAYRAASRAGLDCRLSRRAAGSCRVQDTFGQATPRQRSHGRGPVRSHGPRMKASACRRLAFSGGTSPTAARPGSTAAERKRAGRRPALRRAQVLTARQQATRQRSQFHRLGGQLGLGGRLGGRHTAV